ncbi:hypothetical protein Enr13x_37670 [Stieleria neptunia]|uniref:RiboL-PSP-HEPN domain-containing protein n=1 Tax=Stieleria neptunia TaxID=2527979 RepID=A0A518HSU2_9BACT|nr:hypothetical protein Enr13x_37670 [Stieleria neptunia]
MRAGVLENIYSQRLGVKRLSRQPSIQADLGSTIPQTVEHLLRTKLDGFITRRNQIIHRGPAYYTSSETEIKEAAKVFETLVMGCAEALDKHLQSL